MSDNEVSEFEAWVASYVLERYGDQSAVGIMESPLTKELWKQLQEKDERIKELEYDVKVMTKNRDICCRLTLEKDAQLRQLAEAVLRLNDSSGGSLSLTKSEIKLAKEIMKEGRDG